MLESERQASAGLGQVRPCRSDDARTRKRCMAKLPRIAAAPQRISMVKPKGIAQAPRIAATPRTRGRKWMNRRERWLMDNPLCCDCQAEGKVSQGEEVDHIVPLWAGGADDESNYASRCKPHHAAKTAREAAARARGEQPG